MSSRPLPPKSRNHFEHGFDFTVIFEGLTTLCSGIVHVSGIGIYSMMNDICQYRPLNIRLKVVESQIMSDIGLNLLPISDV